MNKRLIAALAAAAVLGTAALIAAPAAVAALGTRTAVSIPPVATATTAAAHKPKCHAPQPSAARPRKVMRHISFDRFARLHGGSPATVLSLTIQCGPGIQSLRLFDYLDRGNLHAKMPAGVWLWILPAAKP